MCDSPLKESGYCCASCSIYGSLEEMKNILDKTKEVFVVNCSQIAIRTILAGERFDSAFVTV